LNKIELYEYRSQLVILKNIFFRQNWIVSNLINMETCLVNAANAAVGTPANIFSYLIQTLLMAQCNLREGIYPPDRLEEIAISNRKFDFVIDRFVSDGNVDSVPANRFFRSRKSEKTEKYCWSKLISRYSMKFPKNFSRNYTCRRIISTTSNADDNDRWKRYRFYQGELDGYERKEGEFELQSNYIHL